MQINGGRRGSDNDSDSDGNNESITVVAVVQTPRPFLHSAQRGTYDTRAAMALG